MAKGVVVKAVAGFFTVDDGAETRVCKARGVFRKRGVTVLVGDDVEYEPVGDEGVITNVLPRRTELVRPPIANVHQAILVASVGSPEFQSLLLDRMLVMVEAAELTPIVVISKADLAQLGEIDDIKAAYQVSGYRIIPVSVHTGLGIADVRDALHDKISVLAGASGVGKSSLANALYPGLRLKMGEVSEKLGRGKHTTRHMELFRIDANSWLADTPGFSQLDLPVDSTVLRHAFPEFSTFAEDCGYRRCLHTEEDDCAVKQAVANGFINDSRYAHYRTMLQEIQAREERQY